eukprot:gb/GECG01008150.1/.p1 GENE.gb/GECG01008150.1/~~gb/GECG01008150.1/.p1  ORF type:complete len:360 (+),score=54.71 gb/GECG01008150.1/:1-1080(+)
MSMDAEMERRRAAVFAKLEASRQQRNEMVNSRLKETGGNEKTEKFWSDFNELSGELHSSIESIGVSVSASEANKLVEQWTNLLEKIRKLIADSTMFLPTYDAEKAQQEFKTLQETFEEAKAKVQPRKRFAFSRPKKTKDLAKASELVSENSAKSSEKENKGSSSEDIMSKFEKDLLTVEEQHDSFVLLRNGVLENGNGNVLGHVTNSGDLRLVNMSNCVIVLLDTCGAVRVDNLNSCTLYAGPISGSVLLHNCCDSTFCFISRQARLHTSKRCDFYVCTASRPIIEHCSEVRFAPYILSYPDLEEKLKKAELERARELDMWKNVDDFGWHKQQSSPNWSIVPDAERIQSSLSEHVSIVS